MKIVALKIKIIQKVERKKQYISQNSNNSKKKSHICEEGGAHLRISFWHLLMNLKIFIKKTVEVGQ